MATPSPSPRRTKRILREQELVAATRALWDERGVQVAGIEEIATEVGIARGLIYRLFSSKEELFVLTVTDYLDELAGELRTTLDGGTGPDDRLDRALTAYARYCLRHPAFIDGTLSLMQRPASELRGGVSDGVWLRLGRSMASCLGQFSGVLADPGFRIADPDTTANLLWAQMLGTLQLARLGVGVRQLADGEAAMFPIATDAIVAAATRSAKATVAALAPS